MTKPRVLVSSLDPAVARFMSEVLPRDAFEVLPPCLPRNVVEAVLDHAPDILLFEVDRQAGPAAETLRVLRKVRPGLRIIVLSQDSRPEDADIVEAGIFYYDTKPAGEELVAVVKAAATLPRSGRS